MFELSCPVEHIFAEMPMPEIVYLLLISVLSYVAASIIFIYICLYVCCVSLMKEL